MDSGKVLGQAKPSAATLTTLYTVPGAAVLYAVVSSIVVCNQGDEGSFRLSVAVAGAADDYKQYLYYDAPIFATDTHIATVGLTLATTDVVRCYSAYGTLAFQLFGIEVS